ncbi:hypothetical protein ACLOJK_000796 [Asimina triloba]
MDCSARCHEKNLETPGVVEVTGPNMPKAIERSQPYGQAGERHEPGKGSTFFFEVPHQGKRNRPSLITFTSESSLEPNHYHGSCQGTSQSNLDSPKEWSYQSWGFMGPVESFFSIKSSHPSSPTATNTMNKPPPIAEIAEVIYSDEECSKETAALHAKWWYSAFHIVTAMVGAGHQANELRKFSLLPPETNSPSFAESAPLLITMYHQSYELRKFSLLRSCHGLDKYDGRSDKFTIASFTTDRLCQRFDRYYELGQYAFGPKLGLWVVLPQQLIVQVGCDIVYMVTGGKCLKKFMEIAFPTFTKLHQSYWICIFGSIHFFLSQLPNFNSVAGVSLAAAIMSLSYSTISWVVCLTRGPIPNVSYAYKNTSTANALFRVCNALGQISFAFAGHGIVLEIQATVPSTPGKPSKITMWKGAVVAYFTTAICYFPTAMVGYWAFGQVVDDNLLLALKRPEWLIAAANLMVVIHVIGSYQVYAMPVFDMLERLVVRLLEVPRGLALRLIVRTAYVGEYHLSSTTNNRCTTHR